ncbi:MAG TPA: MBL fold metallo-hydrolase [Micromonosporaceae bacterium]|nr:MBL fold metallo-hydrolase [Micromonosporaceae bacterium]
MRITVLGSCGAWPTAGRACSGFLVEHDGFRLLVDMGYATLPRLLSHLEADQVDAVWISHGHPDHCADLNPLLRARALAEEPPSPLPVYAPPGALDAVLALDRPGMLVEAYDLREVDPGERYAIGPFDIDTRLLPHWVPNAGIRLTADGKSLVYTGDAGPSPELAALAQGAELLVAEATYVDEVPGHSAGLLSSARDAGREATRAGVGRLVLTHLWPGTDPSQALSAAAEFAGPVEVAVEGLTIEL